MKQKIEIALSETKRLLSKDESYSEDLQKKDKLNFYKSHINKLNAMLLCLK